MCRNSDKSENSINMTIGNKTSLPLYRKKLAIKVKESFELDPINQ